MQGIWYECHQSGQIKGLFQLPTQLLRQTVQTNIRPSHEGALEVISLTTTSLPEQKMPCTG